MVRTARARLWAGCPAVPRCPLHYTRCLSRVWGQSCRSPVQWPFSHSGSASMCPGGPSSVEAGVRLAGPLPQSPPARGVQQHPGRTRVCSRPLPAAAETWRSAAEGFGVAKAARLVRDDAYEEMGAAYQCVLTAALDAARVISRTCQSMERTPI